MARDIHDHFFHKAKDEGYRSRAAFKLIEIDDKKKILTRGDRVLDAGCAPGSWLQVAARRVATRKGTGQVVGIDLQVVEPNFREDNVHLVQGDFTTTPIEELLAPLQSGAKTPAPLFRGFNVLLSDMAPSTTGDRTRDHHASIHLCESLLDRCAELLVPPLAGHPGGHLVFKVFEGEAYPALLQRVRSMFTKAKGFSPQASRSESTEIYLIGHGYLGAAADPDSGPGDDGESDPRLELPKRKPSKGWGADES